MIRISLSYLYEIVASLEPLETLQAPVQFVDVFFPLHRAEQQLQGLIQSSVFSHAFRSSTPHAVKLLEAIQKQTNEMDFDKELQRADLFPITHHFTQYKIAFLAELGTFAAYFVTPVGGYDTFSLLDSADRLFPEDLASKVPEAMFDIAEAGKCLAFGVNTAAGFHLFRATESVLRRYYSHVTGGKAQPKVRNIAVYINAMTQSGCGDPKILAALKQISDLHRNPLMHPEDVLTSDDALGIVGIARSAITAMLAVLPLAPVTTSTAISPTSLPPAVP